VSTFSIVELEFKPETVEAVKVRFKDVLGDTRSFGGCQSIDVLQDLDENAKMVLYMEWDSIDDHKRYIAWRFESGTLVDLLEALAKPQVVRYFDRVDA
jgi:quinol monooxygenase YgiN